MARALTIVVAVILALPGCSGRKKRAGPATKEVTQAKTLPRIVVSRERSLVYTFKQGGQFRTVQSIDEVPLPARGWVRVQDPSQPVTPSELVYVADLRRADKTGNFAYRVMRREQFLKGRAPLRSSSGSAAKGTMRTGSGLGQVVLYTRPGCQACDSARRYLTQRGVTFVEKNVQTDQQAAQELTAKAARKGFPKGVVPVIDVGGEIVVGLDVRKLESLLRRQI